MISFSVRALGTALGLACLVSLGSCLSYDTVRCNLDADCGLDGATCRVDHVCVVGDAGVTVDGGTDAGPSGCNRSADCTDVTLPICGADMKCRACDPTLATSGAGTVGDGECSNKGNQVPPHCQTTGPMAGQCIGCRVGSTDCAADKPVCGTDNTCRGCTSHDECPLSLVCNDDGKCADVATVAYVDKACPGSVHDGGKATPYCEIVDALAATKPLIHVAGNATAYKAIALPTGTTRLVASTTAPRAVITSGTAFTPVVTISLSINTATDVTLDGLEITDIVNNVNGISCLSSTQPVKLTIRRMLVHDLSGVGLTSTACDVTMDRSKVAHNGGGGITLNSGKFLLTNNFFVANGTGAPAVTLGAVTEMNAGLSFVHNTVADNVRTGTGPPGGVFCTTTAFALVGSLLSSNSNSNASGCTVASDSFSTSTPSDVVYVSPAPSTSYDYSLVFNNPANQGCCVDKVDKTHSLAVDYFGTTRPIGKSSDIGAHEVQ